MFQVGRGRVYRTLDAGTTLGLCYFFFFLRAGGGRGAGGARRGGYWRVLCFMVGFAHVNSFSRVFLCRLLGVSLLFSSGRYRFLLDPVWWNFSPSVVDDLSAKGSK